MGVESVKYFLEVMKDAQFDIKEQILTIFKVYFNTLKA